jgi:nucleoside-diphosphate-sugar epimerase
MGKHVVTGGSGFLGNLIATQLLKDGHQVVNVDIWQDPAQHPDIRYVNCDIRDENKLRTVMRDAEYVHHTVALVPLTKSGTDFWAINVKGSEIAARSALAAGVSKFIHMSSSAIYGVPSELPISSSTPTRPVEIYGRAKLEGEMAVKRVLSNSETRFSIIRPRTILGDGRLGIFQMLFDWIDKNRNVYILGTGDNLFQFIHASDLMTGYMLAIQTSNSGEYNIGAPEFSTMRNALTNLIEYADSSSPIKSIPTSFALPTLAILDKLKLSPLAPWHYLTFDKPFYFDTTPLQALGWKPQYSNDRMFAESYDWFLRNRESDISNSLSPHRKKVSAGILNLLRYLS